MKASSFGDNESGQCGHVQLVPYKTPTQIEQLNDLNIVQVSCGDNHSLFLTDTGEVYGCGDNKRGQLGIETQHQTITEPQKIFESIKKIGCGQNFSVLLDTNGNLLTFGASEVGQLGYNPNLNLVHSPTIVSSFKYISDEGEKSLDNIKIIDFSCGANHTVCV